MEPPDALDDDVSAPASGSTSVSDAQEVNALRRQVESLQLAKAQLEKQLEAAHLDWQLHSDDPNGLDRSGDLFSEESQEVINSSEGEGSDGGVDSDDGAEGRGGGGGGGRTSSSGDRGADQANVDKVMEENAGVPVPVRRESRTVSAEMFPAQQATSVSKTIKPRASFRLLIEVRSNQYVWWEFATANRDIAFGVQFHCPAPEVKYNTADALVEGILTQARWLTQRTHPRTLPLSFMLFLPADVRVMPRYFARKCLRVPLFEGEAGRPASRVRCSLLTQHPPSKSHRSNKN
jgi:hypothetical protein